MLAFKFYIPVNDNNINDFLVTRTKIYFNRTTNITAGVDGYFDDYNNEYCTYDHFSSETKSQFDKF